MVKTSFFSIVLASIWVIINDVFKTLVRVRWRKGEAQDHYTYSMYHGIFETVCIQMLFSLLRK